MKNVNPNTVWGYGGLWFSNNSAGTPAYAEIIGSFEILRNDFTINTSSASASQWYITESGTFSVKWTAIAQVSQTPADTDIWVIGSNGPYTPTMNGGTRLRTDVYRQKSNYSLSGVAYHSVEQSWVHTSNGGAAGNMHGYAREVTNTQALIQNWIYQRIEITKL